MNLITNNMANILKVAEELPEGNIISFDIELIKGLGIIWINVILLVIFLWFILYKPVRKFLDNRTQMIQDNIDESVLKITQAEELKKEYEIKLKQIDEEREKVLSAANKQAMERSDHILKEAKKEADNIYNLAMSEIEEERNEMQNDIKKQLVELSVLIAGRFIEDSMDEEAHNKYIKDALSEWEEGLWLD